MRVAVIDGQGGGIGRQIVDRLNKKLSSFDEIIALGTNRFATDSMLKAGATFGVTGQKEIINAIQNVDFIVGVIGIIIPDSINGEITAKIATAIAQSKAHKIIIPLNRCNVEIAGVKNDIRISDIIDDAVDRIISGSKLDSN